MANITCDQVRARLRTLSELEVTDDILQQAPYIPAGDAWLDKVLSGAGLDFEALASEQPLAVAAEIAFVAHKVVTCAPVRGSKSGPIEIKPIPEIDKVRLSDELRREWMGYLSLLGCSENENWWSSSCGGDSYD